MIVIGKRFLPTGDIGEVEIDEDAAAEAKASSNDPKKQVLVGATLLAVIVVMATGIVPLQVAAVIGALFLVISKCVTEQQAYRGIDWVTIFLFAGMMPVATAMDKSGAGKLIAETVVGIMGGSPSPLMVTAILFILSCGLTQFMSNTASAALLCPIGISIAEQINYSPPVYRIRIYYYILLFKRVNHAQLIYPLIFQCLQTDRTLDLHIKVLNFSLNFHV